MNPVNVSLLVFACAFGAALFGMFIKRLLPAHHISPQSKEVVMVGMGMVVVHTTSSASGADARQRFNAKVSTEVFGTIFVRSVPGDSPSKVLD